MRKRIIMVLVGALVVTSGCFAASSDAYGYTALQKLARGTANIVTAPLEIIRNVYIENQYENILYGTTVGLGKGLFKTLTRFGSGLIDALTFPFEFPKEFREPIVEPEYAWEEWY